MKAYSNKNVYTAGQMKAGSIQSDGDMNAAGNASVNGGVYTNYLQTNGRLSVGEFAMFNGVANAGWGCSPSGLQGRDPSGGLLSCVNGIWKGAGGAPQLSTYSLQNYNNSYNYLNLGSHDVCLSLYGNENDQDDTWRGVQNIGGNNWRITIKNASETAICLDW